MDGVADRLTHLTVQVVWFYRRVERQRRWSDALFRLLATLPLFDCVPLNYETMEDIRDARWFIYIRMPFYPSISIYGLSFVYRFKIIVAYHAKF